MVRTIGTAVDTVVGQIERCKKDNAVPVKILFNLFCQTEDFFVEIVILTGKKNGRVQDFLVINKILRVF